MAIVSTAVIPIVPCRMLDVADRLTRRARAAADRRCASLAAVEGASGTDVTEGHLVDIFVAVPDGTKGRVSPAERTGIRRRSETGQR